MNARNRLKSLAVSSDSEPEVEPFITQTKAALVAVLQELSENNLNLHLRVQKTSKQLTISIFAPRIFRPTCMFTDKEDSGRGITTVTDKEIHDQSRNEARIPQNTKRSTPLLIHYSLMPVSISLAEKSLLLKVQLKLACFCLFVCLFVFFYLSTLALQ